MYTYMCLVDEKMKEKKKFGIGIVILCKIPN